MGRVREEGEVKVRCGGEGVEVREGSRLGLGEGLGLGKRERLRLGVGKGWRLGRG